MTAPEVKVFTSAAFNYIPKVRMLFSSLREFHPEWRLYLALADEPHPEVSLVDEPFDGVLPIDALGIPQWRGWAFCHSIVELATAIKPFALRKLLAEPSTAKVIYLDPDTVAFSRLDDILAALDEANLVLTPHLTSPERSLAAVMDNEISALKHGIYNLGFLGVAATDVGKEFAAWWAERLYHFCRADIPNGLFTDQRWIDLVPAFFQGVAIMRSSRHNVATWNVTTRRFATGDDGRYVVDDEPLGFYHFTGFDSGDHHVMAAKYAGDNKALKQLIDWYVKKIERVAGDPLGAIRWAFGTFSDGAPITKAQRLVYRERPDLQVAFPDPFDATGYLAWWRTQGRLEYPTLFDDPTLAGGLAGGMFPLTPGFGWRPQGVDFASAAQLALQALRDPRTALALGRKGWEVLRAEGLAGVMRRLNR